MKKCKICSKEFQPFSSLDRTCSSKCKNKHIAKREKEKRQKVRLKKKESISELTKVADVLWSKDTRKIGYCEYCGKTENLNAHHIIGRNNKSVRWEPSNGICLCAGCHTFSSVFSAHKTPTEFTYWLENKKGRPFLEKLQELSHIPLKVTTEYLKETIAYLKTRLQE